MVKIIFKIVPPLGVRVAYFIFCRPRFKKIRLREEDVRLVGDHTSIWIGNNLIKKITWGTGTKKALLVHGWESNGGSLGGFIKPLIDADFTVTTFDGPAHGHSSGRFTNILEFSGIIAELLKQESFDLIITHSFGSAATVLALNDHQELSVKKLIMLTAPNKVEEFIETFSKTMGLDWRQVDLLKRYISTKVKRDLKEMKIEKMIKNIRVNKILLIHDVTDNVLPFRGALEIARSRKEISLYPVVKKGHYRMLWNKEIIAHVQDFATFHDTELKDANYTT